MNGGAVTAVIPNWNGQAHLERALACLRQQTEPPVSVLVVDNGSTDGSRQTAVAAGAEWVGLDRNYGFARAVNEGISRVRTEYAAVINNDAFLQPEYLQRLRNALEQWGAGYATGRLLQPGGKLLDGSFDLVCRGGTAWRAGFGRAAQAAGPPQTVTFVPMTATLFRTSVLRAAGGLDEKFQSYLEDIDFGWRCARAGQMGVYVPEAEAEHIGSATLGTWSPRQVYLLSRNQVLLVAKHYPLRWFRRWGWAVIAAQGLWGLVAMRRGCGLAWLRGKVDAVRHYAGWRRGADPFPARLFGELTCANESRLRELGALQDAYWRWYFRLVR